MLAAYERGERMEHYSKRLLRLNRVLEKVPVSKSTWWEGVAAGIYPPPIKLSSRITVWLESDIDEFIDSLGKEARAESQI